MASLRDQLPQLKQENEQLRRGRDIALSTGRGSGLSVGEGMVGSQPVWVPIGPSLIQTMGWNGRAAATAAGGLGSDRRKVPKGSALPANWWQDAQKGANAEDSEPAVRDGGSAGERAADRAAAGAKVGLDGKDKNNPK